MTWPFFLISLPSTIYISIIFFPFFSKLCAYSYQSLTYFNYLFSLFHLLLLNQLSFNLLHFPLLLTAFTYSTPTTLSPPPPPPPSPYSLQLLQLLHFLLLLQLLQHLHFLPLIQLLQLLILPILPQNLPDADGLWNKSDAYVRVKVAGQEEQKTPSISGELNPIYKKDNTFVFQGGVGTVVELAAMDWDPLSYDDILVQVNLLLFFSTKLIISSGQYHPHRGQTLRSATVYKADGSGHERGLHYDQLHHRRQQRRG